jgi:predicted DNA-binding transcriptional regulator AlpA
MTKKDLPAIHIGQEILPDRHHMTERFLSAATLADILSVSIRTVWRLRASGKLPKPVEIGGAIRWRASDISEWSRLGCPELLEFEARTGKS